jgi:iron only hydrogenase large subunit-like protein
MFSCPTGAIRIRQGKAAIRHDWCIDCGECMKACPVNAIFVEQDDFARIFNYECRVAILPAAFIGQFSKQISIDEIIGVIKELGFTHVIPAEYTVDAINEAMLEAATDTEREKPLISSFCPAVVRLIQVKFPGMVDHILPIKSPIDATAMHYKKHLLNQGMDPDQIGVFYVTPCAAKIAAVKSVGEDDTTYLDGVINMDLLYNKVYHILKTRSGDEKKDDENQLSCFSAKSLQWSLTSGEANNMQGRCLAIDEVHNVMKFLERVENGDIINVDFLELRACDHSCAGGVLMSENRFLTVERIKTKAAELQSSQAECHLDAKEINQVKQTIYMGPIEAKSMIKLDEDMEVALRKMQRIRHIMCFLPAIDCGACGAPNCQSLAEDIVRKEAHLSNCVFIQRMMEKTRKLSNDHALRLIEKTWGKDRLDKDCNKKGAKNEGV